MLTDLVMLRLKAILYYEHNQYINTEVDQDILEELDIFGENHPFPYLLIFNTIWPLEWKNMIIGFVVIWIMYYLQKC